MTNTTNPNQYMLSGITPKMAHRIATVASVTVILLALAAAILSYSGLYTLALDAGFYPALAYLLPIVVDGMVLVGSVGVLYSTLAGIRVIYPWFLMLLGIGFSVIGNIAVAPPDVLSRVFHALPPIVFALSCEELMRVYRHRITLSETLASPPALADDHATFSPEDTTPKYGRRVDDAPMGMSGGFEASGLPTPPPVPVVQQSESLGEPVLASLGGDALRRDGSPSDDLGEGHPVIDNAELTARDRLTALVAVDPSVTAAAASRRLGVDRSYLSKMLKEIRATEAVSHEFSGV